MSENPAVKALRRELLFLRETDSIYLPIVVGIKEIEALERQNAAVDALLSGALSEAHRIAAIGFRLLAEKQELKAQLDAIKGS